MRRPSGVSPTRRKWHEEEGPLFSFFGATPESWIGKLWPRGRAWQQTSCKTFFRAARARVQGVEQCRAYEELVQPGGLYRA